jgi:hypothetical protein
MLQMLIRTAKRQGIKGFTGMVLETNRAMMRVFEKSGLDLQTRAEEGVFSITMTF